MNKDRLDDLLIREVLKISSNVKWLLLSIIPISIVTLAFCTTQEDNNTDPTERAFKEWLQTESAVNPVTGHLPEQDGPTLVYYSGFNSIYVRATVAGSVSKITEATYVLSGKNDLGQNVLVYYDSANFYEMRQRKVEAGEIIGKLDRKLDQTKVYLYVSVEVDGRTLQPTDKVHQIRCIVKFEEISVPDDLHGTNKTRVVKQLVSLFFTNSNC